MPSATRTIADIHLSPADRFVESWETQPIQPDLNEFVSSYPNLSDRELADLSLADLTFRWRSGSRPAADEYLRAWPRIAQVPELKLDIVYGEYRARQQLGLSAEPDEFCRRFPDLADALRRQIETAEYLQVNERRSEGAMSNQADEADARAPLTLDDYELGEMLGSGAMGEVFRAEQKSLARPVAIKFLKYRDENDKQVVERFLREAQTTARLRHPNIVDVRGIGRSCEGRYFLVMDLIDGISLEQRLQQGPLAVGEAVDVVCQVAGAVEHAHACAVIHRDLKPANILIDRQGQVLVTDFGLAKSYSAGDPALSMPGHVIGTPHHMAPEQVDRQFGEIGPATDVYGLGSLLYTLLTGRPPYLGETVLELLLQATSATPITAPSKIRAEIPPSVEWVCLKSLSRSPKERFGSAAEVRLALQHAGDAVTALQPTVAMPKPKQPVAARRRLVVAATAVSLFLLAASVIVLWQSAHSKTDGFASRETPSVPATEPAVRVDWTVDVFPNGQLDQRTPLAAYAGPVSSGDMIRIRLDFSRPAYAYVLWFGSEGSLQCLFPKDGRPQQTTANVEIPGHEGKAMPIEGASGIELCVVVLRDSILEDPVAPFAPWAPDAPILKQSLEVALLDGYPVARQPSADGPLRPVDRMLASALSKLPADPSSRRLGTEQDLRGVSAAESLWHWQTDLPPDLGSVHWLAIPYLAAEDSDHGSTSSR